MTVLMMVLAGTPVHAADVVQGANLLGMGGVGVAAPSDNAGITLNPGTLGLRERFDFHAHGRLGPDLGLQWAGSAMDARTSSAVAVGFAYSGDRYEPPFSNADLPAWVVSDVEPRNRKRFQDFAGAIAVPMLDRRLSVGIGGVLTQFDHDQQGSGSRFDMHAGLGIAAAEWLTLGASVRNFIPLASQDRPLQVLAGIHLQDEGNVAFEANLGRAWVAPGGLLVALGDIATRRVEDPSPWTVAAGIDKTIGGAQLRAGGSWVGPSRRGFATLGIGTVDEGNGGIEYAVVVPVTGDVDLGSTIHQISVRFGAPQDLDPP